jgi:hypothetical protein
VWDHQLILDATAGGQRDRQHHRQPGGVLRSVWADGDGSEEPGEPALSGCWAARQTLTDPTHVATAAMLRHQFQAGPRPAAGDQLVRDLADYDRAFGVHFTTGTVTSDDEVASAWPKIR